MHAPGGLQSVKLIKMLARHYLEMKPWWNCLSEKLQDAQSLQQECIGWFAPEANQQKSPKPCIYACKHFTKKL